MFFEINDEIKKKLYLYHKLKNKQIIDKLRWTHGFQIRGQVILSNTPCVFIYFNIEDKQIKFNRIGFTSNCRRRYRELKNTSDVLNSTYFAYAPVSLESLVDYRRELKNFETYEKYERAGIVPDFTR